MADIHYPIVIVPISEEDGGGFAAYAPDLHGCIGDGATEEEAIADIRNAMVEWIDEATRLNRRIPKPGSLAKRAAKERRSLRSLVDTQDRVLQEQDVALDIARAEIASIKARMEELAAIDDDENWAGDASLMLVAAKKKRSDNENMPH